MESFSSSNEERSRWPIVLKWVSLTEQKMNFGLNQRKLKEKNKGRRGLYNKCSVMNDTFEIGRSGASCGQIKIRFKIGDMATLV